MILPAGTESDILQRLEVFFEDLHLAAVVEGDGRVIKWNYFDGAVIGFGVKDAAVDLADGF